MIYINTNFYNMCRYLEPVYNRNLIIYFSTKNKHYLYELINISDRLDDIDYYGKTKDSKTSRLVFLREFFFCRFGKNNQNKCNKLFDQMEYFLDVKIERQIIINEILLFYRKLTWLYFCTDHYWFSLAAEKILQES